MLDVTQLDNDWRKFKFRTFKFLDSNDFNKTFEMLEGMGHFGYKYNFIKTFTDSDVENFIQNLSNKIFPTVNLINNLYDEKVVFYDFFIFENRGFTQQYLEYLLENNYEILFLTDDGNKINEDNTIIKSLRSSKKVKITSPPLNLNKTEKLIFLKDQISTFQASKIFVHNSPWDILSCCLGYVAGRMGISSFLLNITDHTYWPGKDCFTNFIDFRKYGYQINNEVREIEKSRLLIIPTPNYQNKSYAHKFEGFPIDVENKIVGFSGGTFYKIIDKENTFLNLIKDIILQNHNFVFFFANIGGDSNLKQFISKHKLENQFILLGNRTDIDVLFENIHIYFNTYPYGGGLMLQYASRNNMPILAFLDKDLVHTSIDQVLDIPYNEDYVITNKDRYLNTANKLIRESAYREEFSRYFKSEMNINEVFTTRLKALLHNVKQNEVKFLNKLEINSLAISDFHIQNDILYSKEYSNLKTKYIPSGSQMFKQKLKLYIYKLANSFLSLLKKSQKFRMRG